MDGFISKRKHVGGIGNGVGCSRKKPFEDSVPLQMSRAEEDVLDTTLPFLRMSWQPLLSGDRRPLTILETQLNEFLQQRNRSEKIEDLDKMCMYFSQILVQDFPPEIFLQRPKVLKHIQRVFYDTDSSRASAMIAKILLKLTKRLEVRVECLDDPSMHNLKQEDLSFTNSDEVASSSSGSSSRRSSENVENEIMLKTKQISIQSYVIQTYYYTLHNLESKLGVLNSVAYPESINNLIILLHELNKLWIKCMKPTMWNYPNISVIRELIDQVNIAFNKLASVIEVARIIVKNSECTPIERCVYLNLLVLAKNLLKQMIPSSLAKEIIPRNLKVNLTDCLLDASFTKLYPNVHDSLYAIAMDYNMSTIVESRYNTIKEICKSMTYAVDFLQSPNRTLTLEFFKSIRNSMHALEFHRSKQFIRKFFDICVNKLSKWRECTEEVYEVVEDILLPMLAHSGADLKLATYNQCYDYVYSILSKGNELLPEQHLRGACFRFFWRPNVFFEIICYGLNSDVGPVKAFAQEIMYYILNGKAFVADEIWTLIKQSILPNLPLLQCFANSQTPLGKDIAKIVDPDIAEQKLGLSKLEIIKGNLRMLMSQDATVRKSSVYTILWLLSCEIDASNKLPSLRVLRTPIDDTFAILEDPIEFKEISNVGNVYRVNDLLKIMEILTCIQDAELRKNTMHQLSTMLEDKLLHKTFLDQNGFNLVMNTLKDCLHEFSTMNYPDTAIPAVTILKNLCMHDDVFRRKLAEFEDIYYLTIRTLILFIGNEDVRSDAMQLLALLLYSDFLITTNQELSVIWLIAENMQLPFKCKTHWRFSHRTMLSVNELLVQDECCAGILRLHWNIAWYGGLNQLLSITTNQPNSAQVTKLPADINDKLRLIDTDLTSLKNTSPLYCCKLFLNEIQKANSKDDITRAVLGIELYLTLFNHLKDERDDLKANLVNLEWEQTFNKFLHSSLASVENLQILAKILRLLQMVLKVFMVQDKTVWITTVLKDTQSSGLANLLKYPKIPPSNHRSHYLVYQELVNLISECATIEQRFNDISILGQLHEPVTTASTRRKKYKRANQLNWLNIVQILVNNLKESREIDNKHKADDTFHEIAYVDWTMSCLVQITASLEWSNTVSFSSTSSESSTQITKLFSVKIGQLIGLIRVYHLGKGRSANAKFMCSNITRNVMLTMNHLMCDLTNKNEKGWENLWLCRDSTDHESGSLQWLNTLWNSRDTVTRAATVQLIGGLSSTSRGATEIVRGFHSMKPADGIWILAIRTLLDYLESSTVREQAAILLANLTSHASQTSTEDSSSIILLDSLSECQITPVEAIVDLFSKHGFFEKINIILNSQYCQVTLKPSLAKSNSGFGLFSADKQNNCTKTIRHDATLSTPSLIKSLTWLLNNLINLDVNVLNHLNPNDSINNLLDCLTSLSLNVSDKPSLVLYIDLIEMNTAICTVLAKAVHYSVESYMIVVSAQSSLNKLIELLNLKSYSSNISHLLYLRNTLWCEIFNILAAILRAEHSKENGLTAINRAINAQKCEFLEVLFESLNLTQNSQDAISLQLSAIAFLTAWLKYGSKEMHQFDSGMKNNVENGFDSKQLTSDAITQVQNHCSQMVIMSLHDILDSVQTKRVISLKQDQNSENVDPNGAKKTNPSATTFSERYNLTESRIRPRLKRSTHTIDDDSNLTMAGAELCKVLMRLYILNKSKSECAQPGTSRKDSHTYNAYSKSAVLGALTCLLCVSNVAKRAALEENFFDVILNEMRAVHGKLSMESVENLKNSDGKKRLLPLLTDLSNYIRLMCNFILNDKNVKSCAISKGLPDLIHKLWTWITTQHSLLNECIKLLCTFTADCDSACRSLLCTSSIIGVGPRKSPASDSLFNGILSLLGREFARINRCRDLELVSLLFHLLQNCCDNEDCCIAISKSNISQAFLRLHPDYTKRQKPWDKIEILCLEFLERFTYSTEGQLFIFKSIETLNLIFTLANVMGRNREHSDKSSKFLALTILRNIAFNQNNRFRLVESDKFRRLLLDVLQCGTVEEKGLCVTIVWLLVANNHKAKKLMRDVGVEVRMRDVLNEWRQMDLVIARDQISALKYVVEIFKQR